MNCWNLMLKSEALKLALESLIVGTLNAGPVPLRCPASFCRTYRYLGHLCKPIRLEGGYEVPGNDQEQKPGWKLIYCRWIRHPKTGRKIYPKRSKVFRFWVRDGA